MSDTGGMAFLPGDGSFGLIAYSSNTHAMSRVHEFPEIADEDVITQEARFWFVARPGLGGTFSEEGVRRIVSPLTSIAGQYPVSVRAFAQRLSQGIADALRFEAREGGATEETMSQTPWFRTVVKEFTAGVLEFRDDPDPNSIGPTRFVARGAAEIEVLDYVSGNVGIGISLAPRD